ncbi:trypsin-like peptidase domain-containing protein [Winogradskyella sp. DF17]|uniref:Trypsin-like peptidase domain-containing protein n=1 Tax=Winogradskyella pelagia TaxID=2819984 RepID=A0ABS3T7U4_9FLAO|nr:trypsin-like peptidase domain-containing protein [Winogradskyella sp. DF17]MBO3117820.1 trypsin-like peptidase domain-containing protein [Winogradskyella sp. DF17]
MKTSLLFCILAVGLLQLHSQDLSSIYEKVSPAVVVVLTTEKDIVATPDHRTVKVDQNGLGSGFMISDKYVITAAHVVTVPERLKIQFSDGEVIPAKVISSYKTADLALLELFRPRFNATTVKLGDSDELKVGEQIFIVGAPYGLSSSLSSGYVSSFRRTNVGKNPFTTSEFIQTDAAINQGNSGGPMFNLDGEVVGIVSYITTQSGGFDGIGYASSSNLASNLLINNNMPWLGADMHSLTAEEAKILNIPQKHGLLVQRVSSSSIFGRMGIKGGDTEAVLNGKKIILGGDIILKFNDIKFNLDDDTLMNLSQFAENLSDNSKFKVTIMRSGELLTLESKE